MPPGSPLDAEAGRGGWCWSLTSAQVECKLVVMIESEPAARDSERDTAVAHRWSPSRVTQTTPRILIRSDALQRVVQVLVVVMLAQVGE
jgi:hypothetical protein